MSEFEKEILVKAQNAQKALDAYRQIRMEDAAPDRPDGTPADGNSEGREESA